MFRAPPGDEPSEIPVRKAPIPREYGPIDCRSPFHEGIPAGDTVKPDRSESASHLGAPSECGLHAHVESNQHQPRITPSGDRSPGRWAYRWWPNACIRRSLVTGTTQLTTYAYSCLLCPCFRARYVHESAADLIVVILTIFDTCCMIVHSFGSFDFS